MAKAKGIRHLVDLKCTSCGRRNYTTEKNKRNTEGKLKLRKFCPFERKHTVHEEKEVK